MRNWRKPSTVIGVAVFGASASTTVTVIARQAVAGVAGVDIALPGDNVGIGLEGRLQRAVIGDRCGADTRLRLVVEALV